jgi:hypothetical protein
MFLILPIGASISKNIAFSIPYLIPPLQGQKFWVLDFLLLFGGPSISVPNFSFLPRLEVVSFSGQTYKLSHLLGPPCFLKLWLQNCV